MSGLLERRIADKMSQEVMTDLGKVVNCKGDAAAKDEVIIIRHLLFCYIFFSTIVIDHVYSLLLMSQEVMVCFFPFKFQIFLFNLYCFFIPL